MKVLAVLESRATYGYARPVMKLIQASKSLVLDTLVTGMHLNEKLGNSLQMIEADGFPISAKVKLEPDTGELSAWPIAMGHAIAGFGKIFDQLKPDLVLLFGDRVETFSVCIAATYAGIPTAHVQAGDKSGHIDDMARMAMAKLVNIHFASCKDSEDRLLRLGEQNFRIYNVGAPQLDEICEFSRKETILEFSGLKFDLNQNFILVIQHPVMVDREKAAEQVTITLDALSKFAMKKVIIAPNSDVGYLDILDSHSKYSSSNSFIFVKNLERDKFLSLLSAAKVLVGNSSVGILEAPSFKLPVVNVGDRQRGRPQSENILNCEVDINAIFASCSKAINDQSFLKRCSQVRNLYGDGKSSKRIVEVLENLVIDRSILDKETVY